jgi:3-hydroxyisobutyrate dehydrogenase
MSTIGFVGLGAMGAPMARNLLARGFEVRGFDVRASALDALEQAGGTRAGSAADTASGADMLLLMVVNAAQAEAVLFEGGALGKLPEGALVTLMATCPPGAVQAIADRVETAGRRFVDAPVSGGVAGAEKAALTIMAAAPKATFEAARSVFEALGDKVFHVGERPGQGATVKTINQLLCGVHIAVVAEAFALAQKVGVDLGVILEIMSGSSASSWMLKNRGPRMLQAEPEVTSAVDIFVKDLGIVLEAGREAKAALPLAAIAHQLFLATSGRGDGAADDSQVIRTYALMNGTGAGR